MKINKQILKEQKIYKSKLETNIGFVQVANAHLSTYPPIYAFIINKYLAKNGTISPLPRDLQINKELKFLILQKQLTKENILPYWKQNTRIPNILVKSLKAASISNIMSTN